MMITIVINDVNGVNNNNNDNDMMMLTIMITMMIMVLIMIIKKNLVLALMNLPPC